MIPLFPCVLFRCSCDYTQPESAALLDSRAVAPAPQGSRPMPGWVRQGLHTLSAPSPLASAACADVTTWWELGRNIRRPLGLGLRRLVYFAVICMRCFICFKWNPAMTVCKSPRRPRQEDPKNNDCQAERQLGHKGHLLFLEKIQVFRG